MAPKRKRTEESAAAPATRATRSSARGKTATASTDTTQAVSGTSQNSGNNFAAEDLQQPKKAKKTASKAAKGSKSKSASSKPDGQNDRAGGGYHNSADRDAPRTANTNTSNTSLGSSTKDMHNAKTVPEPQPYTATQALALFSTFAEEDEPTVIGPDGFEKLCNAANIPMDGALPLLLAWQFGASEIAKLSRTEWVAGTSELQISSLSVLATALRDLEDLLLLDKPPLAPPTTSSPKKKPMPQPYNRTRYYQYAADKSKAFSEVYFFCFVLAKSPQARNIDMDTALAFWSVLVVPQYAIMQEILDFINEKSTYKGVNKDIWTMVLEFCRTISPTLENYEDDGAWPTMLDEFVSWKKTK